MLKTLQLTSSRMACKLTDDGPCVCSYYRLSETWSAGGWRAYSVPCGKRRLRLRQPLRDGVPEHTSGLLMNALRLFGKTALAGVAWVQPSRRNAGRGRRRLLRRAVDCAADVVCLSRASASRWKGRWRGRKRRWRFSTSSERNRRSRFGPSRAGARRGQECGAEGPDHRHSDLWS